MLRIQDKAEGVAFFVFGGLHNVHNARHCGHWFQFNVRDLATFDHGTLTRLVVAAHDFAARVELQSAGFAGVKVMVWDRERTGDTYTRHPTIEDALEGMASKRAACAEWRARVGA